MFCCFACFCFQSKNIWAKIWLKPNTENLHLKPSLISQYPDYSTISMFLISVFLIQRACQILICWVLEFSSATVPSKYPRSTLTLHHQVTDKEAKAIIDSTVFREQNTKVRYTTTYFMESYIFKLERESTCHIQKHFPSAEIPEQQPWQVITQHLLEYLKKF